MLRSIHNGGDVNANGFIQLQGIDVRQKSVELLA
jgi:hypothetical protein